jgi:small basic protein
MEILDTIMDYLRLVAYAVVVLTSLRGIAQRKFSNLLFVGDIVIAIVMAITVIYIHLFEIVPSSTLVDDIILSSGAIVWALVHFKAMLKDSNGIKLKKGK